MNHDEFEKKLMEMLLVGDDPVLEGLRNHYHNSKITSRYFTGAGFYTHFQVRPSIPPVPGKQIFELGDIYADIDKFHPAFGFVLFVEQGYISFLEGYTLTCDIWPDDYSNVTLKYEPPNGKRDLQKLKQIWTSKNQ